MENQLKYPTCVAKQLLKFHRF